MTLTFVQKYPVGGGAVSFEFTPDSPIDWTAGQSIRLEVPTIMGAAERRFTISSAPFERHITVTTRIGDSDFKQALDALEPGQTVAGHAIEGTFVWTDAPPLKPLFIAAGIGITPYHAMIKQRQHNGLLLNATLIYGASTHDMPFASEIANLQQDHPELAVVLLAGTRMTAQTVQAHVNLSQSMIYVSGPSVMVDDMTAQLLVQGMSPGSIKRDWFTGRFEGVSL